MKARYKAVRLGAPVYVERLVSLRALYGPAAPWPKPRRERRIRRRLERRLAAMTPEERELRLAVVRELWADLQVELEKYILRGDGTPPA